jgi:hypothetical protein
MVSIEDLYKYFGILADAKEEAGKVNSDKWLHRKPYSFNYNILILAFRCLFEVNCRHEIWH